MFENPREAGKEEILHLLKILGSQIVFRTDILRKLTLVAWFNSGSSRGTTTLGIITKGSFLAEPKYKLQSCICKNLLATLWLFRPFDGSKLGTELQTAN